MAVAEAPARNGKSAADTDSKVITIAPLKIQRIEVPIRGTQPLITNKFLGGSRAQAGGEPAGAEG